MRTEQRHKNRLKAIRDVFIAIVATLAGLAIMIGWTEQAYTYSNENVNIQIARENNAIRKLSEQGLMADDEARLRIAENIKGGLHND